MKYFPSIFSTKKALRPKTNRVEFTLRNRKSGIYRGHFSISAFHVKLNPVCLRKLIEFWLPIFRFSNSIDGIFRAYLRLEIFHRWNWKNGKSAMKIQLIFVRPKTNRVEFTLRNRKSGIYRGHFSISAFHVKLNPVCLRKLIEFWLPIFRFSNSIDGIFRAYLRLEIFHRWNWKNGKSAMKIQLIFVNIQGLIWRGMQKWKNGRDKFHFFYSAEWIPPCLFWVSTYRV